MISVAALVTLYSMRTPSHEISKSRAGTHCFAAMYPAKLNIAWELVDTPYSSMLLRDFTPAGARNPLILNRSG
jgi:hypothetical protein